MREPRSGKYRRQDDLEHDHQDHSDGPLPDERSEAQANDEHDDSFEFEPQPALDHQRVRRIEELSGVVGKVHGGDLTRRFADLGLRGLRSALESRRRFEDRRTGPGAVAARYTVEYRPDWRSRIGPEVEVADDLVRMVGSPGLETGA